MDGGADRLAVDAADDAMGRGDPAVGRAARAAGRGLRDAPGPAGGRRADGRTSAGARRARLDVPADAPALESNAAQAHRDAVFPAGDRRIGRWADWAAL